jgi:hypothetical protein
MDIGRVPTELFQILKLFLKESEYCKFLNTSNELGSVVKYETREIIFNEFTCRRYLYDAAFKDLVLSKVKFPLKQFRFPLGSYTSVDNDGIVLVDPSPNVVLVTGQMLQGRYNIQPNATLPIVEMDDFETMHSSTDERAKIRSDVSNWTELRLEYKSQLE